MRKLLVALVVALLLLAGADRLAVKIAESVAARGIQRAQGLPARPHFTIEGFPFLTQLVTGDFKAISISAVGGGSRDKQSVPISSWQARATHIHADRGFHHLTAGSATGSALISYANLTNAISGNSIVDASVGYGGPSPDGHGRVAITATLSVLGQSVQGAISAEVLIAGPNKLGFGSVQVENVDVPQELVSVFSDALTQQLRVTKLPAGLQLSAITATAAGITGTAQGENVIFKR